MKTFREIHDRALARKGEETLNAQLPKAIDPTAIAAHTDDRWLAAMTKRVFSAGFVWRVIDAKWAGFEAAFMGFDPIKLIMMPGPDVEALAQDARIVRNRQKINATFENAQFVLDVAEEHGSFGAFIAAWPDDDLVGLWALLKTRGARLGGDTGARLLRQMGKPSFILSRDVIAALVDADVIEKKPTSKTAQRAVQAAFNTWQAESGLNHSQMSVVLAHSIDAPKR
jgi:3-methyladenine DNA glycosylase Tag